MSVLMMTEESQVFIARVVNKGNSVFVLYNSMNFIMKFLIYFLDTRHRLNLCYLNFVL